MTRDPAYRRVTLRGGPASLDGETRHAIRGATRAWFMEPMSDRRHEYAPDPDNPDVWRYVEEEEQQP